MKTRYYKNPFPWKGEILFCLLTGILMILPFRGKGQIAEWTFENISSAVPSLPIAPSRKIPQVRASATLSGGHNNGSPDACSGSESWSSNFWPTSSSRDAGSYLEFSVKADPGESFDIDYFSFSSNASSANSALNFEVYYSKNNFITSKFLLSGTQSTGGCSNHGGSVGVTLLSGSTIKFRIYPYGQNVAAQAATIRVDNVSISGSILPVSLSAFTGRQKEDQIELSWTTVTELNNDHFMVERSGNGIDFLPIGQVPGAGNSQVEQQYHFRDKAPLFQNNYYRLRQVDIDGTEEVHPIIHINFKTEAAKTALQIWPTIAGDFVNIRLENATWKNPLWIRNMNGLLIKTLPPEKEGMVHRIPINELSAGWYLLQYQTADELISKRFYKS